jgi:hypothetical protein
MVLELEPSDWERETCLVRVGSGCVVEVFTDIIFPES